MNTLQEQLQKVCVQLWGPPEKVQIIIDECNLRIAARSIHGKRLECQDVCDRILRGHRVASQPPKIITDETDQAEAFARAMMKGGLEVEAISGQWSNGKPKSRTDPYIHVAIVEAGDSDADVIALVSGDGDFEPMLRYQKENKGKIVEVYAVREAMSTNLWAMADRAEYLDVPQEGMFAPEGELVGDALSA